MIACDGCDRWFHTRCVGMSTAPRKDKKWFCKDVTCQAVNQEYQKQKKAASRTKKIAEEYDKLSTKSSDRVPPSLPPGVEEKLREMEAENKRLEKEMDAELLLRRKEMEMKNALKERRMRMEKDLREKELEKQRLLREKEIEEKEIELQRELQEKEAHLIRIQEMEKMYRERMLAVDKQLYDADGSTSKQKKHVPKTISVAAGPSGAFITPVLGKLTEANVKRFVEQKEESSEEEEEDSSSSSSETTISKGSGKENGGVGRQCHGPNRVQILARSGYTKKFPTFLLLQSHLDRVRKLDSPRSDKLASFIPFGNAVEQLCEHLEAADLTLHLVNPVLIQDLVSKLPDGEKRQWVQYKKKKKVVTLRTFTDFISGIVSDACEANVSFDYKPETKSTAGAGGRNKQKALYSHSEPNRSSPISDASRRKQKSCRVCQRDDHRLRFCQDFRDLPYVDKMKVVTKWKLCHTCLNDHSGQCRFKIRCTVDVVGMSAHIRTANSMVFRMIPIQLHCGERSITVLAFLDEGASVTLIENDVAERLGLTGVREKLTINWTSDIYRVEKNSMRMNVWSSAVGVKSTEKFLLHTVNTVEKLMLPHQTLNAAELTAQYKHMRDLPIASYDGRPGLLIGINNIHTFAPREARIGTTQEPIAVRCKLGWTVYGPRQTTSASGGFLGYHQKISNEDLHDILKNHYALEESVIKVRNESVDDRRAREIMEHTTKRVGNRFETGLLWKMDEIHFPDSYLMATKRMKQLENRLYKSPELFQNVRRQIEEYQEKGYAHLATKEELAHTAPDKVWYLPLNVVVNAKKPSKVRLIWDAAATVHGVSLNSMLLKGPDLLAPLVSVITGFREKKVAFGGDIREMYHQLKIISRDKQAQRFLFRNNHSDEPRIYVMDVATFGSTCSPASAQFVKNQNAADYALQYPEAAAAIVYRHYVDDYFDSVDTIEEAIQRAKEVRYIHKQAGFDIRNWVSNSPEFLSALGEAKSPGPVVFQQDKQSSGERVLGVIWDVESDMFAFSVTHRAEVKEYLFKGKRPTKRIVLSCVMGLFDPLGLLSPFTIHGKVIIQHLWRNGCEWDQEINEQGWSLWKEWTALLPEVEAFRVPRCYLGDASSSSVESIELHIFTDASEHAYGCVSYLRTIANGVVRCSLVMSRAKVAPLKRQSIPRLELMAAVLGARMKQTVVESHSLPISRTILWTDSRTVLSWLQSDQHKFKQFVAFRIGEILDVTHMRDWRWVPTKQNIADVLTKWGHGPPLQNDSQWVHGPSILYQSSDQWALEEQIEETLEETRGAMFCHAVIDAVNISSWTKLLRVTATVLRFASNCRRKKDGRPIAVSQRTEHQRRLVKTGYLAETKILQQEELQRAETVLWRQAQFESFPEEMDILEKNLQRSTGQPVEKIGKSSSLYKRSPALDEKGVMRVRGRLERNEALPFDKRFPIILSGNHEITKKLILHFHNKFAHANRETVFNELRQKFWIPKARAAIKKATKECMWCKVNRCVPSVPMMAPLPVQRITSHSRPFSAVGVDYLGPVEVTVGRRKEKRWIAVFTCMAVRAVHLEVVHTLTTQSCLMAFRRFACKRGVPEQIFSDNATCFRGAEAVITKKINNECAEKVTSAATIWHFNPPGTPHMGGVWERMVRSVKEALRALEDGRKLTDEILSTTLAEAEDIINTRPLIYIPQESSDEEAITPNHFLRGMITSADMRVDDSVDQAEALKDVYKRSQYLANKMWERWSKEYLPSLNHRPKWFDDHKQLEVGDLVFIVDGKNRKSWIRGRVQNVIQGADGRIRQADVRTANGKVHRRAVVNLAVFEIQSVYYQSS
ncbi:uncharacterized protein LOC134209727 [Armigeres subalbatus]|uniref:uncharacterized protein LOC134209727 n=1 Tax=Armigeres subalbatus TaxID=124917 RepID=UPI002ED4187F